MELQKRVLDIIKKHLDWCDCLKVSKIKNQEEHDSYVLLQQNVKRDIKLSNR